MDFLTAEEKSFVLVIREQFRDELTTRREQGKAFSCFFGSVAIARILQAVDGHTDKAIEWFQSLLRTLSEESTEALVLNVLEAFAKHNFVVDASILPHYDTVKDFFNAELCAPKLSSDGDMIMYLPLVDLDRDGILQHLDWDHWVKFSRASTILQCAALDRISRGCSKVVKLVLIVDMEGLSLEGAIHRTFARAHRRDVVDSFQQKVAAEIVTSVHVINVPWTIANLFSLCKTFLPAKFLQKFKVLSGDSLQDASFVKQCGGEEQLSSLLSSRKGLVSHHTHDSQQLFFLDTWPNEDELHSIANLRGKFAENLAERQRSGTDWPCFFSDVALARVLRGNEGYFSEASNWFQTFLRKMEKYHVDEIVQAMNSQLEASKLERAALTMLPHADEVGKYFRCTLSAPKLTPSGDVIWFIPLGDFDRKSLVQNVRWEDFVEFLRALCVLRALEAQRLSEVQHRMAKCITILDLQGSGIGATGIPKVEEFDEPNQKNVKFMREILIDILGPIYVLNAPWVAVKAFNWFKTLVPARFSRKLVLLDGDGASDLDFVELVGEGQLKHLLATRVGLLCGEVDGDLGACTISAGESLNKVRNLKQGETISWSISVESGDADSWFGVSDILSTANMIYDDLNSEGNPGKEHDSALEELWVLASDGEVTREYTADRNGVIRLCWSNEHSRMRAKNLRFHIDVRKTGSL